MSTRKREAFLHFVLMCLSRLGGVIKAAASSFFDGTGLLRANKIEGERREVLNYINILHHHPPWQKLTCESVRKLGFPQLHHFLILRPETIFTGASSEYNSFAAYARNIWKRSCIVGIVNLQWQLCHVVSRYPSCLEALCHNAPRNSQKLQTVSRVGPSVASRGRPWWLALSTCELASWTSRRRSPSFSCSLDAAGQRVGECNGWETMCMLMLRIVMYTIP